MQSGNNRKKKLDKDNESDRKHKNKKQSRNKHQQKKEEKAKKMPPKDGKPHTETVKSKNGPDYQLHWHKHCMAPSVSAHTQAFERHASLREAQLPPPSIVSDLGA